MSILPEQQSSGSNTRFTRGKSAEKTKEAVRPHAKIPHEDLDWVLTQSPTVIRLFLESWRHESFGKQQRLLKTTLRNDNLRKSMRLIEKAGLFKYQPITELNKGKWVIIGWKCENLHGYYSDYWDVSRTDSSVSASDSSVSQTEKSVSRTEKSVSASDSSVSQTEKSVSRTDNPGEEAETRSKTEFQNSQPLPNYTSTNPLPPTKVVEGGSCISQETQQTPLGGAAATSGEMQEEEKEVGTHSPASVKDQAETASDEPTNLGEGESSGGDIATELSSDVAYTEFPFQVGSQITINWPNTEHDGKTGIVEKLYWEAKEVDVQLKGVLAVFCFPMARILGSGVAPSTSAPRFNPEHAQKRKARQSRLKCADVLGECPGAEFLTECWQDILLRSQVKALISKHPEWGIIVDCADQLQCWFDF